MVEPAGVAGVAVAVAVGIVIAVVAAVVVGTGVDSVSAVLGSAGSSPAAAAGTDTDTAPAPPSGNIAAAAPHMFHWELPAVLILGSVELFDNVSEPQPRKYNMQNKLTRLPCYCSRHEIVVIVLLLPAVPVRRPAHRHRRRWGYIRIRGRRRIYWVLVYRVHQRDRVLFSIDHGDKRSQGSGCMYSIV